MTSRRSPPDVTELKWRDPPLAEVKTPRGKMRLTLGPGSGLSRRPGDPPGRVWGIGDRGPNLKIKTCLGEWGLDHLAHLADREGAKVLPLPDFQPCLAELQVGRKRVRLVRLLPLRIGRKPLSGRPVPGSAEAAMEPAFDLDGRVLPADPNGVDTEGLAALADGSFWVCEEYGPSLMRVDAKGAVKARWIPAGLDLPGGDPVLPAAALRRRLNRGFEGVAATGDGAFLYAAFQSAFEGESRETTTIWKLDAATGALVGEYAYPFDAPQSFTADAAAGESTPAGLKVGDVAWAGPDRLLVLERVTRSARIYSVDVSQGGRLSKTLVFTTDDAPQIVQDLEGLTLLSPTELLLSTDNDFGSEGAETRFYRLTFDAPI